MSDPDIGKIERLRSEDPIAGKVLETFARRLQARDPGVLGTYAEHLVADAIGASVSAGAWDPDDVVWDREEADGTTTRIAIQVKVAGIHLVFAGGLVKSVSFGTKSTRSLEGIWAKDGALPARAPVWVLALHGSSNLSSGWRFFVCPGSLLERIGASTIALNTLIVRLGHPVSRRELRWGISHAFDCPDEFADPESWDCPRCGAEYPTLRRLIAHQASARHAWSHLDLVDEPSIADGGLLDAAVTVPNERSNLEELFDFALTFDGYGRYGYALGSIAARVEQSWRAGTELPDDVQRLRAALFHQQRVWRNTGESPAENDFVYERSLVAEIRRMSGGTVRDERPISL